MMKIKFLIIFLVGILLASCEKEKIDGSSLKAFQASINTMSSELSTIEQIKFNEALYIIKTHGVEGAGDLEKLKNLSQLLRGKTLSEILSLADSVAQKSHIDWSSTAPPSLGNMNIFQFQSPIEADPNDLSTASVVLDIKPIAIDTLIGAKELQIIPKLVNPLNQPISFEQASLGVILEIFSNDEKLLRFQKTMKNHQFKGFNVKLSSLPEDRIVDGMIDVLVMVDTPEKQLKMLRKGVRINQKALEKSSQDGILDQNITINDRELSSSKGEEDTSSQVAKNSVSQFLRHLNGQDLKAAYDASANPEWGSYEQFSNPTSGFGMVKNVLVKNISTKTKSDNMATVNTIYQITDKNGNVVAIDADYTLKLVDDKWKITSYKINSSEKK